MKKLYKVLNGLVSPYLSMEYEIGKKYHCSYFDNNVNASCARGFYATDIDGLPYAYRPYLELYECEVWGKEVEYDQYKRRYENIKLIREVPKEEIEKLANDWESTVGFKLRESLFPVNPLEIEREFWLTKEEEGWIEDWIRVAGDIGSVRNSVWNEKEVYSNGICAWDSVGCPVRTVLVNTVEDMKAKNLVSDSVRDVAMAYISSLFYISKWDGWEEQYPFESGIKLWRAGLVPSYDGYVWRVYVGNGVHTF